MIRNLSSRTLARLFFVAAGVGVVGVTIDLVRGPPALAVPAPAAHASALAVPPLDHSVVSNLTDDVSLEPGASVAAYDSSIGPSVATVSAQTKKGAINDDALEPGASVAAYGS